MTQVCHRSVPPRAGGLEAFGEITEVVPWDIMPRLATKT